MQTCWERVRRKKKTHCDSYRNAQTASILYQLTIPSSITTLHRAGATRPPQVRVTQSHRARVLMPDAGNGVLTFWTGALRGNVIFGEHIAVPSNQQRTAVWTIRVLPFAHVSRQIPRIHKMQPRVASDFARAQ